jgi:hypothetical protein
MPDTAATDSNVDVLLSRRNVAEALTALGFKTAESTLATLATRGGGPPFKKWSRRALYRWGDALLWAEAKLSNPVSSTSELKPAAASITVIEPVARQAPNEGAADV